MAAEVRRERHGVLARAPEREEASEQVADVFWRAVQAAAEQATITVCKPKWVNHGGASAGCRRDVSVAGCSVSRRGAVWRRRGSEGHGVDAAQGIRFFHSTSAPTARG